ncbi:MAG: hypothetical protein ABIP08_04375, partial [Lautropia sp.]
MQAEPATRHDEVVYVAARGVAHDVGLLCADQIKELDRIPNQVRQRELALWPGLLRLAVPAKIQAYNSVV